MYLLLAFTASCLHLLLTICYGNHKLIAFVITTCYFYFCSFHRTNPLGMKGHIARRYGDLTQDLWSGSSRSLAPLKLRVS